MTFHYWDVELFALMTHSLEIAKDSPTYNGSKKSILFFAYFEISMVLLNPLICLPVLKLLTGVVHSDWVTFPFTLLWPFHSYVIFVHAVALDFLLFQFLV